MEDAPRAYPGMALTSDTTAAPNHVWWLLVCAHPTFLEEDLG